MPYSVACKSVIYLLVLFFLPRAEANLDNTCILDKFRTATDETTVAEIRESCAIETVGTKTTRDTVPGAVEERIASEKALERQSWSVTPHRSNYFLGVTKNSSFNYQPFSDDPDMSEFKEEEMKFQISLKFPLWYSPFGISGDLYAAYSNQSWWQAYSTDISQPFREVNHEPEVFMRFPTEFDLLGLNIPIIDIGFSHQSNGRSEPLSRSWNRLYANFVFERNNFAMSVKPWIILGDSKDNPDIDEFMGHGELRFAYRWNDNIFGAMLRNNLQTDENRSGVELSWSYPVTDHLRIYTQYYYGYGESLIDYNARTNRFGIGVALNDYLQ